MNDARINITAELVGSENVRAGRGNHSNGAIHPIGFELSEDLRENRHRQKDGEDYQTYYVQRISREFPP